MAQGVLSPAPTHPGASRSARNSGTPSTRGPRWRVDRAPKQHPDLGTGQFVGVLAIVTVRSSGFSSVRSMIGIVVAGIMTKVPS